LWNLLNRAIFRLRVRDINCAFKLFKRELIADIPLISSGAMISSELLVRLKDKGAVFAEVPVSHLPRRHGKPTGARIVVVIKALRELVNFYRTRATARKQFHAHH
jgi:hypothetical protein